MDKIFTLATAILMTVLFAVSMVAVLTGHPWHLASAAATAMLAAVYYVEFYKLHKAA